MRNRRYGGLDQPNAEPSEADLPVSR
jgi:hypothetical protein